jgi:hypothetical protein
MDYKNGKIYTIRSYQTDEIYIGSTTQTLTKRLSKHKADFKWWKKGKHRYLTSFDIVKYDDVYIELLELCPCENKMELFKHEGEFIRSMDCVNKLIAGRTFKEYLDEYREKNKDKIKQKFNCDCGGKYIHQHKSTHLKTKKHQAYILNVEK